MAPISVLFFVIIALEIVFFYCLCREVIQHNRIVNNSLRKIKSLNQGFYAVTGVIKPFDETLRSPFSETECVYYRFKVIEDRGKSQARIVFDENCRRFLLDDGSGMAIVDLQKATVQLDIHYRGQSRMFNPANYQMQNALSRYNKSSRMLFFEKSLSYYESVLRVGDRLYICGEVVGCEQSHPVFKGVRQKLLVSDKTREQLMSKSRLLMIVWIGLILLLLIIGFFMAFHI